MLFIEKIFKDEKQLLCQKILSIFKQLRKRLNSYGVKIHTDAKILPKWENNKLKIYHLDKEIENDKIIWTGDPTKLINDKINKDINSRHLKILQTNLTLLTVKILKIDIYKFSQTKKL